ncbi:MAG: tRNA (adenosine(37)-N6)-dimethylallyltransferase MiaA, partial [Gemmataceae bacterium]
MILDDYPQTLILTGPTGSGKSRLALDLAERLGAEIMSMDSMALYRRMDIGTAKPTVEDRRRVPHHLLDVLEPWESASVAWWLERAGECCRDIVQRGRRPLFVGGTPLYLKTLLHGLFEGPPAEESIRRRLSAEAAALGGAALHARLAAVDALSAARLHPHDVRRIIRALEVWELTGRPMSAWQTQWKKVASDEWRV